MNKSITKLCLLLIWSVLITASPFTLAAQNNSVVTGVIMESGSNETLPGATVMQKGHSQNAAIADSDGKFSIRVNGKKPVLIVTFVGMDPQEVHVTPGQKDVKIVMKSNSTQLDDVVVTALGITREQRSLGYAVSKIGNEELNTTVSGNWLNAMNGKIAGMTMDGAGTGPMGSKRVVLRGDQSLNYGANEALFVIDGVPMSSGTTSSGSGSNFTNADAPVDFGNDAADINPEDVESVTVLKGPAATALYGSRAANGAIVITTKSGKPQKGIGVTINSSVTWEKPSYWPDFQKEYGPGNTLGARPYSPWAISASKSPTGQQIYKNCGNIASSFGAKFDPSVPGFNYSSYDFETGEYHAVPFVYADDWYTGYFRTGVTYNNSVTVEGGNGKGTKGRLSVTDMRNDWVLPNTGYKKNSVAAAFNVQLNKWITLSTRVNYYNKRSDNIPVSGYNQNGINYKLLWLNNFDSPKSYWAEYSLGRLKDPNIKPAQYVNPSDEDDAIANPYYYLYEATNSINKNRVVGNAALNIKFPLKGLTLMLRGAMDMNDEFRTMRKPAKTFRYVKGGYKEQSIRKLETNIDFLLRYENNDWLNRRLSFNVSFGGNNMDVKGYNQWLQLKELDIPGIFTVTNSTSTSIPIPSQIRNHKVVNSLYGFASLGWDNTYFLDITARNDWSSTLVRGNWSFFYPSISAAALLDRTFKLQEKVNWIDMLKVRASWANVGNDTNPYSLIEAYTSTSYTGSVVLPTVITDPLIKPENVESWEAGIETRFLLNRVGLDAAVYDSKTTNQIVSATVDAIAGANAMRINAGEIRNRGIELTLHLVPVMFKDFSWTVDMNWSKNWNKLVSLTSNWDPAVPLEVNTGASVKGTIACYSYVGQPMNVLYGRGYQRAPEGSFYMDAAGNKVDCSGQILINENDGYPMLTENADVYLGRATPDWNAGLTTSLRYKWITLSATFTGSYGGHCYSITNAILSYKGKLKNSLPGRQGGLVVQGVNAVTGADGAITYKPNTTVTDAINDYYSTYKYVRTNAEENTFSTSFFKMKELRVDFNLPQRLCRKSKVFKAASLSFYATNLFCITKWPQFDPEEAGSMNGTDLYRGTEAGSMPMSRTYGVNLKLSF